MFKRRLQNKRKQSSEANLQLSSKMYFLLLASQLINLLTLSLQLHIVYIAVAILLLLTQLLTHYKLAKTFNRSFKKQALAVNRLATATNNKDGLFSRLKGRTQYYSAPSILASWQILALAILGSIAIAISGRELGLLLSMVHLLCFAYSLKIYELPKRKDLYQFVILGMFIATSSLIFHQSVYFSIVVICLVFANSIVLLNFFSPTLTLKQQGKTLAKLMLLSLPLAIVLFVGFPKLAPFWQVPNVESAKVGLSEQVKIGDIAQLALSDELAFRVSFNGNIPAHSQQYWRALVLEDFDGASWQQSEIRKQQPRSRRFTNRQRQPINAEIIGQGIEYQVITEPSYQSWLFALDFATSEQANVAQREDFALYYRGIINQTLSYKVTSFPDAILSKNLADNERVLNLTTSLNSNPRLKQQGQELRQQFSDNEQLINHVLGQFNQQQYFYTLQPPRLSGNTLDQFYFDTKAGFCEHYASAFTYLMRAAGIPARLVVGYLGGEVNPTGNYLTVYQRNAHAWSEVWLVGQGWVRVDPTAAVDSERVERGFSSNLMREYSDLSSGFFSLGAIKANWLYNQLKQQFEALDYQWTRWVIGYTDQRQSQVLKRIISALPSLQSVIQFIAIALLFCLFIVTIRSFLNRKKQANRWQKQYLTLVAMLEKQNIVKEKSMTAMQFALLVTKEKPELLENFTQLSTLYCQLQYQFDVRNPYSNSVADNKQKLAIVNFEKYYQTVYWQLWKAKFKIR